MAVLFVTEFNAVLRRSGNSLVITLDEDPDGTGGSPHGELT